MSTSTDATVTWKLVAAVYVVVPADASKRAALIARLDTFVHARGFVPGPRYLELPRDRRRGVMKRKLLGRAKTPAFDVVVVATFDDLAVTRAKVVAVVATLKASGVAVMNLRGDSLDVDNPCVRWLANETSRHSKRVRAGQERARNCGRRVGAIPWGFRLDAEGAVVPDAGEQSAVELARQLVADGTSFRKTARVVSARGFSSRSGSPVTGSQVRRWLSRRNSPAP
jgi:hypothetical protein